MTPPAFLIIDSNFHLYLAAFFILPVLVFYGAKFYRAGEYNDAYLSKDVTGCVKGLSIIVVILHHLARKTAGPGLFFTFTRFGYLSVSVFFFLSGYSLMQSLNRNPAYLENFFRRRLGRVYIPVLVINTVTLVSYHYLFGLKLDIAGASKIITGLELIDPVLWFVNVILFYYVVFFAAFRFFSKGAGIVIVFVISLAYTGFCVYTGFGVWWYNTCLCFPVGILYANRYEMFTAVIKKNYKIAAPLAVTLFFTSFYMADWWPEPLEAKLLLLIAAFSCAFILMFLVKKLRYASAGFVLVIALSAAYYILNEWQYPMHATLFGIISSLSFVFMVIVFLMKVRIGNRLLVFAGVISYEMYLVHMKVFNIYYSLPGTMRGYSVYIYLAIVVVTAWLFNKLFDFINQPQKTPAVTVTAVAETVNVEPEPEA